MSTLSFRRPGADPEPTPPPAEPLDSGTIRNWVGKDALPAEMNLEPAAAILDHLRSSDPAAADRLRRALEQFPPVGGYAAGFELVAVLGRGTFGRVYLARQGELADRFVALKISADLSGESRTLARLQHTNVVPIYSVHRAAPFQAVCMPFFGATTLAHLLRRFRGSTAVPSTGRQLVDTLKVLNGETVIPQLGPRTGESTGPATFNPGTGPGVATESDLRPQLVRGASRLRGPLDQLRQASYPDAVCWIGARLADGLDHAHGLGILHNDLKPANVLLTDEGQPMLLDFGVSEDLRVRAAAPGAPVGGTLPYMAPEHLRSVRDRAPATDARSDVYALGLILFELLTGTHPFRVPTAKLEDELPQMLAERAEAPPRLRRLNPAVSPGLEAIVRKCLEADADRRYQTAADLRDDLDRHRAGLPLRHVRVPSVRERVRKWGRRHPNLTSNLTLGIAAAVVLAGCVAGFTVRQVRLERDKAETAARLEQEKADAIARQQQAEAEATARQELHNAEDVARLFGNDLKDARCQLTARAPEPVAIEAGIARCEAALARYGLPADDNWDSRPQFQALPPDEQQRVRGQLANACLLLARAYSLRAKPNAEWLAAALRLNELAERISGGAAPRALWDQRADLLRRLGRPADADRAAGRAKDVPLITADDYYQSGFEALARGRHREAVRLLRRSVELNPASFWTHVALGLAHEGLGQYPDAFACYTAAIALWPDYPGGYHSRGLVGLRMRDYQRAKTDLDRAVSMVPDTADLYLNRALANQGLKDWPAALADLEKAEQLAAPRTRVLLMRSRVKDLSGDKDGAKQDLADGLREKPTDELGWITRGLARLSTDLAGAVEDFDAALALNPRSLPAMQNKAHALSKLGRNDDAIRVLDELLELYPDYVPARSGRGVLNARVGNDAAALADAEESLRRDPSPAITYQAAGIYALLDPRRPGSRVEAIRLLSLALRAGFGHDFVETDSDLDPIRDTPEFKKVVESVRALKAGSTPPR
jgi:serine/threonine protein kinase/Flp pilus assembly protein TadD